jgi:predicted RNA binding protein YcfA (HicA-like mRNA interferase family)
MATFYNELIRLLKSAGYTQLTSRGHGSHEIWMNHVTRKRVTVVRGIKKRHTANGVLAQAGLPKAF